MRADTSGSLLETRMAAPGFRAKNLEILWGGVRLTSGTERGMPAPGVLVSLVLCGAHENPVQREPPRHAYREYFSKAKRTWIL